MKHTSAADKTWNMLKNAVPILYGLMVALLIIGVLSLLFSLVVYFTPMGEAYLRPAGIIISVIALLSGGYLVGRRGGSHGLWRGLALGILYLFILYLFAAGTGSPLQPLAAKGGYTILAAAIGGIWGVK